MPPTGFAQPRVSFFYMCAECMRPLLPADVVVLTPLPFRTLLLPCSCCGQGLTQQRKPAQAVGALSPAHHPRQSTPDWMMQAAAADCRAERQCLTAAGGVHAGAAHIDCLFPFSLFRLCCCVVVSHHGGCGSSSTGADPPPLVSCVP